MPLALFSSVLSAPPARLYLLTPVPEPARTGFVRRGACVLTTERPERLERASEAERVAALLWGGWGRDQWQLVVVSLLCIATKTYADGFETAEMLDGWGASVRAGWPKGSHVALARSERALLKLLDYRTVISEAEFSRQARVQSFIRHYSTQAPVRRLCYRARPRGVACV